MANKIYRLKAELDDFDYDKVKHNYYSTDKITLFKKAEEIARDLDFITRYDDETEEFKKYFISDIIMGYSSDYFDKEDLREFIFFNISGRRAIIAFQIIEEELL